jgi:vacuolar-type H+-ATPase subunit H
MSAIESLEKGLTELKEKILRGKSGEWEKDLKTAIRELKKAEKKTGSEAFKVARETLEKMHEHLKSGRLDEAVKVLEGGVTKLKEMELGGK